MNALPPKTRDTIVFPVPHEGSVYFSVIGVYVDTAVLYAGETTLSIIKPQYNAPDGTSLDINTAPEPATDMITEVPFLGDKPFHAGLARGSHPQVSVTFIPVGLRMPSVRFGSVPGLSWESVGRPEYVETVTACGAAGPVTLDLVYHPHTIGYRAPVSK
jgi:hypothetical protein